ncbi:hypothetical protein BU24DRAFT_169419 [Aaosphaeria arxii CBS 175.79]|uniref:SEC7 domain-containing protein n=1 Tax=Aaosphaeria arxii CBS 175.79 TaxID=1450172 RepID=A0A6A5Y0B6_9PLEO|nr:uncharacterized protein BU24DRAFT_169419 [Aaosphaeria arxii CBS 175.79]KAF2018371.1 hypothetical protein BU24DRAFT_169419 [Aaosphaeria arxii CBS 175.79]
MPDYGSSTGDARDDTRPVTPTDFPKPRNGKSGLRALNTRLTQQETFYDDPTPVDNRLDNMAHDQLRDSHDLSLHDSVRNSIVDNMLLSLDQFGTAGPAISNPAALYSNFDDDDFFLNKNPYPPPKPTRHRGQTYASSQSSDYDTHVDDTASRYSNHHRTRRSNSSNNIPAAMSRKSSMRGYPSLREKQTTGSFADYQQAGHSRGNAKKGSKGSNSSSMDFGHGGFLGAHRLGFGRRSASFDHGSLVDRSGGPSTKGDSLLERTRSAYQNYDYDAAPEPTIPAGPRRIQEQPPQSPIAYPPQPSYAPPQAPVVRRKASVRSTATNKTLRKNKSQPEPNMRLQAQEFVNASTLRDLPPVPSYQDPPAPSPTVATRKQPFQNYMQSQAQPPSTPASTPKEKPGFFRRMFGVSSSKGPAQTTNSSVNSSISHQDASPASVHNRATDVNSLYSQARPQTTPSSSNHIASQLKAPPPPQTANSAQREAQPPPPVLAKKHSSFFRRRKKSITDSSRPPPIMAMDFQPPKPVDLPDRQPSPGVSSLRKVMNPYLNDPSSPTKYQGARQQQVDVDEDLTSGVHLSGFSPGYKPHKDATVRSVKPNSRDTNETPPSSRGEQLKTAHAASNSSPKLKLKMKHAGGRTTLANSHEDTFLADSSSCNEDYGGRATPSGEKQADLLGPRPAESGTDNARIQHSVSHSASEAEDEGWVITTPPKKEQASVRKAAGKSQRVWLEPTSSEEDLKATARNGADRKESHVDGLDGNDRGATTTERLSLPLEGARTSQKSLEKSSVEKASPTSAQAETPSTANDEVFHSASSLPVVQVESRESDGMPAIVEQTTFLEERPTDADRQRAFDIFTGADPAVQKGQAAAVLGDMTLTSSRVRKAYMELFDWTGFNILAAMRDLCGKLTLKAETQQVDRILMSLSERWCECNVNHGFKAADVVHTICYSVLLLNTDLHLADIESRMTRNQFVKNTLPTVVRVCKEAIKDAGEETLRPQSTQFRRGSIPWNDKSEPNSPSADVSSFGIEEEPLEGRRARSRLSVKPPMRSGSDGPGVDSASAECNVLVNSPHNASMKAWEMQIETVLKEFYNSIRQQRLPLHGASNLQVHEQPSSNNLSVSGLLRRTPSVLSKAPSDNISYRGRSQTDFRSVGNRWQSKTRSRPRLYPNSTVASSRTSLDDTSVWSPAGSSTWSKYSFGKTQTSMSVDSLGSHFAHGDYQQAIGFANALSQAIIREEGMTIASHEEFARVAPLLEDETLELVGAPWAKEGILKHKHHLEALDKKAKDRTWNECFAVVEKGYMRLFSFSANSKSMRIKNKSRPSTGGVVGGGNWMDNAEALDSFPLRQSIASALPPPGYSKSRPHVWALSLPTGAVHLFQVGTPDIVREFVSTANYWSARLSKEPLMGGVSSMEYGWGENVINTALIRQDSTPSTQGHAHRPSMASSLRSSVDHATGTVKARLPGDKANLHDWSPPTQSMMASNLMEVDQLRALTDYVKNVEAELSRHNELRAPMLIAFSPRHPNAAKAMANWERKSSYLLREIVKFRTYIDSLSAAQTHKDKIYAERDAETAREEAEEEAARLAHAATAETDGGDEVHAASQSQSQSQPISA